MDMQGTSVALERELNKLIRDRNTMTIGEFVPYEPLFRKDSENTVENYTDLCERWKQRVSIFDKVTVVADYVNREGNQIVLFVLPPMFTRVNTLNAGNEQAATIVSMLSSAISRDNPLRTDVEQALGLMYKAINIAQLATKDRLYADIDEYAKIANDLKPMLGDNAPQAPVVEKVNTADLDWE